MKKKIENTFLKTIEYGTGRGNGLTKITTFLNNNSFLKEYMIASEYNALISGRGSRSLISKLRDNKDIREHFFKANEEWVSQGETPIGYTWHHHQNPGLMLLVNKKIHRKKPPYWGRPIWGGNVGRTD